MAIRNLTTAALHAEIARREKDASKIRRQRDKLAAQLEALDGKLSKLEQGGKRRGRRPGRPKTKAPHRGGTRGPKKTTGRGRGRNKVTLPDAIAAAMDKGAVVSPKEAAKLVKANGYTTKSKTFNIQVSQALTKDKRFKRVGRGQYERMA